MRYGCFLVLVFVVLSFIVTPVISGIIVILLALGMIMKKQK